jgi:hypothetical protein
MGSLILDGGLWLATFVHRRSLPTASERFLDGDFSLITELPVTAAASGERGGDHSTYTVLIWYSIVSTAMWMTRVTRVISYLSCRQLAGVGPLLTTSCRKSLYFFLKKCFLLWNLVAATWRWIETCSYSTQECFYLQLNMNTDLQTPRIK